MRRAYRAEEEACIAQCVDILANILEALFLVYLQSFLGNLDMLAQLAASIQHIRQCA